MFNKSLYEIPTRDKPNSRIKTALILVAWMLGAFLATILVAFVLRSNPMKEQKVEPAAEPMPFSDFRTLTYPTEADLLLGYTGGVDRIFMPTGSGRPESALYGSIRTGTDGRARYHAGVDIAPANRDRNRRPTDLVKAIAPGKITHINRAGGNSSYGIYIVIIHKDDLGEFYSLYAHLASVADGVRSGRKVEGGTILGLMGHSDSTGIPVARAHLHLEIGVMLSSKFGAWARERKIRPDRGNYHGWNLFSVHPLEVYMARQADPERFTMLSFLRSHPVAFEMVIDSKQPLDYFRRHPALWTDAGEPVGVMKIHVSEGGVILKGERAESPEQERAAKSTEPLITMVDEEVLGRNGMRLIVKNKSGRWTLGRAGTRWLDILTAP